MANLNLSQFGEKLFVADADHTFIWDTAASISKKVSRNSWLNSGTLTSDAPVTISQTWNAGTNVMTALRLNVTDTASGSTSKLLELYAGATPVSVLEVDKIGRLRIGSTAANTHGTRTNPAFKLANNNCGFYTTAANGYLNFAGAGTSPLSFYNGGIFLAAGANFQWTSGVNDPLDSSTIELALLRDAANTLALRNGAAAQTFNVYGTWTTAITNFERLAIKYNTTDLAYQIAAEKGTTNGDYRPLQLWTGGASRLHITTAGNVGIGTTAPSRPLTVAINSSGGSQQIVQISNSSATGYSELGFDNDVPFAGGVGCFTFGYAGTGTATPNAAYFFNRRAAEIQFGTTNIERMRITAAGNVGIGTTAPSTLLEVALPASGNTFGQGIKVSRGTGYFSIANGTSTTDNFYGSFIAKGSIPSNALSAFFWGVAGDDADVVNPVFGFTVRNNANNAAIGNSQTAYQFRNYLTNLVTVLGSGNVGIGTTSPTSKLHVAETWNNAGTAFCAIKSVITDTNSAAGSDFLELYSGTSTQPLRMDINKTGQINIYGAWTDASNYERLSFSAPSAANAIIGTNKAGTGTARGLELQTDGVTRMTLGASGSINCAVTLSSQSSLSANSYIMWNDGTSSRMLAPSNGVIQFTNAATTGFDRLQFGGTTNLFPAIKRSSTTLQARLADDSAFAPVQGKLTTDTDYTATVVTPTGFLTLYDAQGTAYRVPCVLAP